MAREIKFTKRYEVYSGVLGCRFLEGSTNSLRKARRMAHRQTRIQGKAIVIDTEASDDRD